MTGPTVFISYSHKDKQEKDELLSHLRISRETTDVWSDDRVGVGTDWEADLDQAISQARVAILLVSPNFLVSRFIASQQTPAILERCKRDGLTVFPVIAKPCAWQLVDWLAGMNIRPQSGKPVWRDGGLYADEELVAIAHEVASIIEQEELFNKSFGKYRLITRVGQGGMATVYKADDPSLARYVAIKVMHSHLTNNPDFIKRFRSEAKAVANLRHPNIIQIHAFGVEQGEYYMVMEFVEGHSLSIKLKESRAKGQIFNLEETIRIFGALTSAVAYAHAKGVVHRDLKPSNIMLTTDGEVILTDFGIARIVGSAGHTMTGTVMGTPAYLSPEQAQGQRGDERSDIYSLGVVLYEMVTGRVPYEADTPLAIIMKHLNNEPLPLPTEINPDLPLAVEHVILKALSRDVDNRYQTVNELAKALKKALTNPAPTIFISYARNAQDDKSSAQKLSQSLHQKGYDVFIDNQDIPEGRTWAKRIKAELSRADFFIALLSADSVQSRVVMDEIKFAHYLGKHRQGRPIITGVRLNYEEAVQQPLNTYLTSGKQHPVQHDTMRRRFFEDLEQAVSGIGDDATASVPAASISREGNEGIVDTQFVTPAPPSPPTTPTPSSPPAPLPQLQRGVMDPQSSFYIGRASDRVAQEVIARQNGVTITITAPRQMGKSSLLMRTIAEANQAGKRVAFLNFSLLFDENSLSNSEIFLRQFCTLLSEELDLDPRLDKYWRKFSTGIHNCTRYLSRYILKELGTSLVLAMDEVDIIFDTKFHTDFFAMLRSWHNSRSDPTSPIWKQLDLLLVTSTEPSLFIKDLNQSPFNVGEKIELKDFASDQVALLSSRYNLELTPDQMEPLMTWLGGNPYLLHLAFHHVVSRRLTIADLLNHITEGGDPFDEHLLHLWLRINKQEDLMEGLRQIVDSAVCENEQSFFRLRTIGLVKRDKGQVSFRCQLYDDYFRRRLSG